MIRSHSQSFCAVQGAAPMRKALAKILAKGLMCSHASAAQYTKWQEKLSRYGLGSKIKYPEMPSP